MRRNAIKQGPARAPARAMLRATGLDDAAIARPLVAVVHTWTDVSPCKLTLRDLAACRDVAHGEDTAPFSISIGTRFELGMSWLVPAIDAPHLPDPSARTLWTITGALTGAFVAGLLAALAVSLAVGLLSGVLPARRAAALDPVEALRTE